MLVMSASEDAEVERFRAEHERCRLPDSLMRKKPTLDEALGQVHPLIAMILRLRIKGEGRLGPIALLGDELVAIERAINQPRPQIMASLLPLAAALSQGGEAADHVGAVVESISGGLFVGAPIVWKGGGVKFSLHGVQSAVMNAWRHGETQLRRVMVEAGPCTCCRQFLRETWTWKSLKIVVAPGGRVQLVDGECRELPPANHGLRIEGLKGRFLGEPRRGLDTTSLGNDFLAMEAAEAAATSYSPYSKNYAGIVLRTKRDLHHVGRYVETSESIAGIMAVEAAMVDLVHCGGNISDVAEIVLVETRGSATQFSITQKLATALGSVPFRFFMVS